MMDSIKPGRYVRYFTNRINSNMFGLIEPPCRIINDNINKLEIINRDYEPDELINVEFIQINNGIESSLHKNIDRNKLCLLTPLPSISIDNLQVPLYAWHKTQSSTGWILVRPIVIDRLPPEILIQKSNYREIDIANKQISFRYLDENDVNDVREVDDKDESKRKVDGSKQKDDNKSKDKKKRDEEINDDNTFKESNDIKDRYNTSNRFLYFTTCSEIYLEENKTAPYYKSPLEMISGEHADAHLLNQLAFTNICHWLKFHIKHMEPEQINTAEVLYQMLRSIHHVVDRVDWEPLVADLVQSNVGGTLLHAARLSACASASALRRVLRASLYEIFRCIKLNDFVNDHTLVALSESLHFQEQIDQLSEEYCRHKALECANAMKNLILEQTYSVQFDVAVDIFDSCYQFEKYLMGRHRNKSYMEDALYAVKENLSIRKRRLAMNDIFEKCDAQTSIELIYEEVKVQFWATKMLLTTPLTSKIYSHFIKQVVDKKTTSDPAMKLEAELEEFLQSHILYEYVDGNLTSKSNSRLSADYDLNVKFDRYLQRYNRTKHILEYVTYALEGINRFKHLAHSEEVVNFLSHLSIRDV